MQRIEVDENGLLGTLYLPKKEGLQPLIITIGGFRGGLNEERSFKLSQLGFASLALAYFGYKTLPSQLKKIPLEYFEKAIDWAANHERIDPNQIALWGISRGAELSLILGSIFSSKISLIAATLPSSAIYGALIDDAPAWVYQGKPIGPNAPFPKNIHLTRDSPIALTPYFLKGMQEKEAFQASQIPVENIKCPILLVSGEDDQMWPSSLFANQIMQRLDEKRSSISKTHSSYEGAGHGISFTDETAELHPILNIWFAFGGSIGDNARAMNDSWDKTINFFKLWLD